ncbi:MAG: PAS domain-containing protein [Bacteroidota bacterium]
MFTIVLYISLAIAFIILFAVFFILQSFIKNNDKALEDLNKNRSLLKGIIDNTPTPISVKNLNGKYIYANKKFSDLFEINKIEVIGKTDLEIFKKDVADQIREKDIEIIKNKSSLKFEEKVKHKDEIISYINTKFPIMDDQGDISAIGTISTDISEKNKLDLELFNNAYSYSSKIFKS